jgi:hypothetical protein
LWPSHQHFAKVGHIISPATKHLNKLPLINAFGTVAPIRLGRIKFLAEFAYKIGELGLVTPLELEHSVLRDALCKPSTFGLASFSACLRDLRERERERERPILMWRP